MSTRSLWVTIDSRCDETRVLATEGPKVTVLKARLSSTVHHPRAVPALLEALAMWEGRPVRAAIVVGGSDDSSATRLKLDFLTDVSGAPLYKLEFVDSHRRRHEDRLDGMGEFYDLRQLSLFEVAR
jgi:hypothetical protein